MTTLTIRLQDEQHNRLKALAAKRGISLNKWFEEFSIKALAEFDVESRFRIRAAHGSRERGLEILDAIDERFSGQ